MLIKILLATTALSIIFPCFAADDNQTLNISRTGQMRMTEAPDLETIIYAPITRSELTSDVTSPDFVDAFMKNLDSIPETDRNQIGRLMLKLMPLDISKNSDWFMMNEFLIVPSSERPLFVTVVSQSFQKFDFR